MDRFIDSIEWLAALFVGIVAADIFISVLLRYFFSVSIPDSYDFGRMLLAILIFWGIAATSYRGTHITVDLVWANVGPRQQRLIDIFATLVLLFVVSVQTYTLLDKVTKYHMDVPFYVTTFAFVFNKDKYDQMSASQKKVIDDHCTNEWAGKIGGPWGEFEHAGIAKLKAEPGHDVYALTPEQLAQWKQAAAPLEKSWGDNVRRVGIDPATAMKELRDQLARYNAGY